VAARGISGDLVPQGNPAQPQNGSVELRLRITFNSGKSTEWWRYRHRATLPECRLGLAAQPRALGGQPFHGATVRWSGYQSSLDSRHDDAPASMTYLLKALSSIGCRARLRRQRGRLLAERGPRVAASNHLRYMQAVSRGWVIHCAYAAAGGQHHGSCRAGHGIVFTVLSFGLAQGYAAANELVPEFFHFN
jgi:hypothetical protein